MRTFFILVLLLAVAIAVLLASEIVAKHEFDRFCKANVGSAPSPKIVADGVELRRGFGLMPAIWPDTLKYFEFSGERVVDGSLFEGISDPSLLSPGPYRLQFYDRVGQECLLFTEVNSGRTFETEKEISDYFGGRRCLGVAKIASFQSEYYVEYLEVSNFDTEYFATILGRPIRGTSFRVYRRSDSAMIGSLDSYSMDIAWFIPKPEGIPHRYRCNTDAEHVLGTVLALQNFFE